jgi:hypothetical protein
MRGFLVEELQRKQGVSSVSKSTRHNQIGSKTEPNPAVNIDSAYSQGNSLASEGGNGEFIRHPNGLPIRFRHCQAPERTPNHLNPSSGGLRFLSDRQVPKDIFLEVSIPIHDWTYQFVGRVVRTRCFGTVHELWLCFGSHADAFQARMAEQICHIEAYRNAVRKRDGRTISSEHAAMEWVAKYAACFPAT